MPALLSGPSPGRGPVMAASIESHRHGPLLEHPGSGQHPFYPRERRECCHELESEFSLLVVLTEGLFHTVAWCMECPGVATRLRATKQV